MPDEFPYDVFLSHSAKDKAMVLPLAERLQQHGLKVSTYIGGGRLNRLRTSRFAQQ